jgi:uncharacterized membrane protein YjjB (DUF3815 family)
VSFLVALGWQMILAALPAAGFGMAFNVPVRALGYCAAGGALARGLRFALAEAGIPLELATFMAAAALSLASVYVAQKLRAHPKVFTVAAMIPMIPGVPFFTALIAIMQIQRTAMTPELLATAVNSGLRASMIVAALAVGLALPGLLFYRKKPVV